MPDRRIQDLFGIDLPIIQAPMTGPTTVDLVVAVSEASGLGSLPFTAASPDQIRAQLGAVRRRTTKPINANFFCHTPPPDDAVKDTAWRAALSMLFPQRSHNEVSPLHYPRLRQNENVVAE